MLATDPGALLSKDGIFEAQIKLLKEKSNFQIFCDEDFEQGFYPVPLDEAKKMSIQTHVGSLISIIGQTGFATHVLTLWGF